MNWGYSRGTLRFCNQSRCGLPSTERKLDFYTLLDNWVTKGMKPDVKQQHYVMAVLIRGGVFGEKSE